MANLTLKNVAKSFGTLEIIKNVDLEIDDGEFVVFVGPSGCGKSTLLRMISGLENVSGGEIHIGAEEMTHTDPSKRGIAMVFQSYALYPHMTAPRHLGLSLRMNGMPKSEVHTKVEAVADMLQLGSLMGRKPAQLSGGQRQRVAIGRALVRSPQIFLFDEPLSNLDAELRVQLRVEISQLHEQIGITTIYVTHDQVEAMTLADKIVVLRDGSIEQVGTPLDLFDNPVNLFVASFIGSPKINILEARVLSLDGQSAVLGLPGGAKLTWTASAAPPRVDSVVRLGIRPQHLVQTSEPGDLEIEVDHTEHLGGVSYVYGHLEDGSKLTLESRLNRTASRRDKLWVGLQPDQVFLFSDDEQRIR